MKFIVALVCVMTGIGCATSREAVNTVDQHLKQVQIGMTEAQVRGVLRRPSKIETSISAGGRHDEWIYTEATLGENLLSDTQQVAWGMAKGAKGGDLNGVYRYSFKAGVLVEMRDY